MWQGLLDYLITPVVIFVLGYILFRIMGKKAVSEMTSFDLLAVLILGTVISEPLVSNHLGQTAYYSVVIVLIYVCFSFLMLHNKFKKFLKPSTTVLIRNGQLDYRAIKKEKLTIDEVIAQLRISGYTSVSDMDMVTMESTGKLSFIPKATKRAIQPHDIQLQPSPTFIEIPLIIDGEVMHHNVKFLKLPYDWLLTQLQAYNIAEDDISRVALATFTQQGVLSVSTSDEQQHAQGAYFYRPGSND